MLSEDEWRGIRENLKQLVLYLPSYHEYWKGERSSFSNRFQSEVDSLLAESYAGKGSTVLETLGATPLELRNTSIRSDSAEQPVRQR